jgi:heme a synthase
MQTQPTPPSTATYRPALATFAAIGGAWIFVLVLLGAFTTTIRAGMIFPDWPLSNGSLNPHGWLSNEAMFAEHSHRLSAGLMSIIMIGLAAWIWLKETRRWLRKLALFGAILIVLQAVVGGIRVLAVSEVVAMLHACLAQAMVCTVIAIAVGCSRAWLEQPVPVAARVRRLGVACCVLLFVQLAIAAVMRHTYSGLAIPTFPWSTPSGGLLPEAWSFQVGIHFAHRAMAAVLSVALVVFSGMVWLDRGAPTGMRTGAAALVGLLAMQVFLGAEIIWTLRDPVVTTLHVLIGALTLATAFWLTWLAHRDVIET